MTVDVLRYSAFTRDGIGGNPAGVVLDAEGLTSAEMLTIASGVGYSETVFASPGNTPGTLSVRYFSPRAEVAFCGHATIALAIALAERDRVGQVRMSTPAGAVTVSTSSGDDGVIRATLESPTTRTRPADPTAVQRALAALGWPVEDLDPAYPPHVAFAGNDHLVLSARSRERLADLAYDFPRLQELMAQQGWTTVCLFWVDPATGDLEVRNPFPPGGVVEDAATGAAAAALGGYLRDLGFAPTPARLTIYQGHHIGRPSRLDVVLRAGVRTVQVSGAATRLSSGRET